MWVELQILGQGTDLGHSLGAEIGRMDVVNGSLLLPTPQSEPIAFRMTEEGTESLQRVRPRQ